MQIFGVYCIGNNPDLQLQLQSPMDPPSKNRTNIDSDLASPSSVQLRYIKTVAVLSMVIVARSALFLQSEITSIPTFVTLMGDYRKNEYGTTGPHSPINVEPYPLLLQNKSVLLFDSVWIHRTSQVVLLGVSKKMFQHKFTDQKFKHRKEQSVPVNITFPYQELKSPMSLLPHLSWDNKTIQHCRTIESKVSDTNCKDKIFTVICNLPEERDENMNKTHHLKFNGERIGQFCSSSNNFSSAMKGMMFARSKDLTGTTTQSSKIRLSIVIKPVKTYHPVLPDIIEYYQKQGVQHVYIGLVVPTKETIRQFIDHLLPMYDGFISLGWHESSDMVFNDTHTHKQQIFLKLMFMNSALFHAKAFEDDLLLVVDIDEVPVSLTPTKTTFVDEFASIFSLNDCFIQFYPYVSWKIADTNSSHLGEMFPLRCKEPFMPKKKDHLKSAAVLKNANFVGIHEHGGCNNIKRKTADVQRLAFIHYTSFWGGNDTGRFACPENSQEFVQSEISTFMNKGFE